MQTMKVLATRMPDEHIKALRAVADARGTNVSIELRRAVKAFLATGAIWSTSERRPPLPPV